MGALMRLSGVRLKLGSFREENPVGQVLLVFRANGAQFSLV
jgi:hypothetical protein